MKGSNAMRAKNIIDLTDLSLEELTAVIDQALEIKKNPAAYADRCNATPSKPLCCGWAAR